MSECWAQILWSAAYRYRWSTALCQYNILVLTGMLEILILTIYPTKCKDLAFSLLIWLFDSPIYQFFVIANFWIDIFRQELSMDVTIKLNVILFIIIKIMSLATSTTPNVQRWGEFCQKWGDDTVAIATDHRCKSFSSRANRDERPPVQKRVEKGRRRYCSDSYRYFNPTTSAY